MELGRASELLWDLRAIVPVSCRRSFLAPWIPRLPVDWQTCRELVWAFLGRRGEALFLLPSRLHALRPLKPMVTRGRLMHFRGDAEQLGLQVCWSLSRCFVLRSMNNLPLIHSTKIPLLGLTSSNPPYEAGCCGEIPWIQSHLRPPRGKLSEEHGSAHTSAVVTAAWCVVGVPEVPSLPT